MRWSLRVAVSMALLVGLPPLSSAGTTAVFAHAGTIYISSCSLCDWVEKTAANEISGAMGDFVTQDASGQDYIASPLSGVVIGGDEIEGALQNDANYFVLSIDDAMAPSLVKIAIVFYDANGWPLERFEGPGDPWGYIPSAATDAVVYLDRGLDVDYTYTEYVRT